MEVHRSTTDSAPPGRKPLPCRSAPVAGPTPASCTHSLDQAIWRSKSLYRPTLDAHVPAGSCCDTLAPIGEERCHGGDIAKHRNALQSRCPSASKVAAIIGKAAFLSQRRRVGPVVSSIMKLSKTLAKPPVTRLRSDIHRMEGAISDQGGERCIDALLSGDRPQAFEFSSNGDVDVAPVE